ncbi:MAG: acyl-CoA dehydrogenase family protein [Deltaproteobacteria bacterium]|nr:acyl-CoA dehydrogenase family protein [Deltaproteobacteria bacterium]
MMTDKQLLNFKPLHGTDFYGADPSFQSLLKTVSPNQGSSLHEKLKTFSKKVSQNWDILAEEAANNYSGPRIESFDAPGNPIDRIWLPPPVRQLRREVVEAGIFENSSQLEMMGKVYLLSHLGESSVVCPLACTEGLIRVIEAVGSDFLKKNYLPKLRSKETPLAGAQFITEQDMGSDVGALTTEAKPLENGQWSLHGEKWFCSAIDEYFLVAARPQAAPKGTEGVAIFFVPRTLDGKLNNLHIKRLKNKIGTKELPTAEIDLEGAIGYAIGPVESGFKNLMNHVINTSRIMNAASACGLMARALLEAKNYTSQRTAFGRRIGDYPMVQESLKKMATTLQKKRSLYFHLIAELDREPLEEGSDRAYWLRFLINLCKYRTAIGATECVHEAILLLGGNGTIETFSILPRLYRDSLVIETWEGTHNVLALQICRDSLRFPFKDCLQEQLGESPLGEGMKPLLHDLDRLADPEWVSRNALHLVNRLGELLEEVSGSNAT